MKRFISVAIVVGLLAGAMAVPAEAAKKKKKAPVTRVVEFDYVCPCGVKVMGAGPGWQLGAYTGENTGGGEIPIGATDMYVTAKAEDSSGQPIRVSLANDTDGDGLNNTWGVFCNETTEPIKVENAEAVMRVFVTSGTCDDGTPAFAQGGKITFTFSSTP